MPGAGGEVAQASDCDRAEALLVAQVTLDVALRPFAIPALTMPFILVSWMFLLPGERPKA